MISLHLLILNFLLCNDLSHQLACHFNNFFICISLSLTCSRSLHDLIQNNCCCVNIVSLKKLLSNLYFTSNNLMHIEFKDFPGHKFQLLSLNVSFNGRVWCKIIMLFVHVLFSCTEGIFISVFVLWLIEGFFKVFSLFFQRLKLTSSNHRIDVCDISERVAWKTVDHFGIREYWLTDCNGIVGVSKLNLTMSKYTSYTDGARLWGLPMSAKCGFIFLIEQWVHFRKFWISYNYTINRSNLIIYQNS